MTNVSVSLLPTQLISRLLAMVGQPARIQILFVIGEQEACVCHLETVLGMRQASISQHLMVLRKAGLVNTHRVGRHIFYQLARPEVIDFLTQAAQLSGVCAEQLNSLALRPIPNCTCPQCNPELDVKIICQKLLPDSKKEA